MDLRTGAAFWPLKNGLIAAYPPLERNERCDVAVIGAGITGALAAHRLTQANCDVIVLDRHDVGMGSTAACTGLLQYQTDTSLGELASRMGIERAVRSWRLGLNAINDLETFCLDPSYGFARRPSVYLASTRWDARSLKAELALRAENGFDVAWLDRPEIAARFGFTAHGAIQSRGDAEVDAYRLTHGMLADAARPRCARVRPDQCDESARRQKRCHADHESRRNSAGATPCGGRRVRSRAPAPSGPRQSAQHLGVCERAGRRPLVVARPDASSGRHGVPICICGRLTMGVSWSAARTNRGPLATRIRVYWSGRRSGCWKASRSSFQECASRWLTRGLEYSVPLLMGSPASEQSRSTRTPSSPWATAAMASPSA